MIDIDYILELKSKPQTLVSGDKFREGTTALQEFILDNAKLGIKGFLGKDPFPLEHNFVNGMYIRYLKQPAKYLSITQIHKVEHIYFILKGRCSILTEKGVLKVEAPYMGITKVGTKRIIWSNDELHFVNVYAMPKMSVEEVEKLIYAEDFEEIEEIEKQSEEKIKEFIDVVSKED